MAKKKQETASLIETFAEFKQNKNIDLTTMVGVLEESFRSVIAKIFGSDENFDVIVNPEKGDCEIYRNRVVVNDDEVEDPNKQISLSEAQQIDATYEVGEINGVKFYLQEFANVDEDSTTDSFYEYASEQVEKYFDRDEEDEHNEEHFIDEIWDFINDMDDGERVMAVFNNHKNVRKICNFIYDEGINDLHSANWGFTNDGREVIIDYSGYKG